MATLTVGGEDFAVSGGVDWSTETIRKTPLAGGAHRAMPIPAYIEATIVVRGNQSSAVLSQPGVSVRLDLGDKVISGEDMIPTGNGVFHGEWTRVRYEGREVREE